MADSWPADLPQKFEQEGFSEGVGDGLLEYQPDVGPPITRRRTATVTRPMSGVLKSTAAQIAAFRSFYDDVLMSGALPFEFPDQLQEGTLLVRFTKQGPPTWSPAGWDTYDLRLTLMVLP